MKIIKILFLFVFLVPFYLFAVKYPLINYLASDGLPQSYINALIQDHLGYILVGTQSGIGKFDGNNFEVITIRNGLPNNFINDFAMDNRGNIWAATSDGLAKIDKTGKISSIMTAQSIRSLKNDSTADTLWIFTQNGVCYLKDDKFVHYKLLDYTFQEDDERKIKGLIITHQGIKYFYSNREILEIKGEKIIHTIKSEHSINVLKWLDSEKKIAVGTKNGLYVLKTGTAPPRFTPYIDLPPGGRNVTDIVVDDRKRIWVGTEGGLLIYNRPFAKPIVITDQNGFISVRITKIIIDREKSIFIGTRWGLAQLSPNLFKMYDDSDGLPGEFVWDFLEDEENDTLLIACDNGIAEFNRKTGEIIPFSFLNQQLKDHSVRVIVRMGQDDFLLGTRNQGLYRWNRKLALTRILPNTGVLDGVKTGNNTAWFATDDGLLKYDNKNNRPRFYRDGLKDNTIWALAVVDNDTLLVGTGKGVQKFYREKFVPSEFESRILENTVVNHIEVISPSEIMVATELNGLYIFKDNQLARITTANGLLNNDVWSVIKDNHGNIWLNTTVSLARRYRNGFISHFNRKTGLFGDEGSIHSNFKAGDGTIYFGIIPGIVEIPQNPTHKSEIEIKTPILHIKEIKVKGKKIPLDTTGTPHHLIRLTHNQNNIEFSYITVSTRKENPVFYKTRLHPLDTQWSEPTRETHIKYLNLPPDDYTFEVIANNGGEPDENQWFKSKNKIILVIKNPFWWTWWFISSAVVLCIFVVYLLDKHRLNRLEKQKEHLQRLVEKRTTELQHLSITDPLTDLKNRRYLEEKIKEDINLIERSIYDRTKYPHKEFPAESPTLGVFILDIDRFKKVNDVYGHKAGDIVIVNIAHLLIEMLRHSDTIVRWGGEEFLIITRQYGKSNSFELAERIRKKVASVEFEIDEGITIRKTVSVGFAHFPFIPGDIKRVTWHQVVSLADSALYIAKNSGRNLSIGIEYGENELDIDFKEVVSDIKMGLANHYLGLVSLKNKDKLKIAQHKT
jgi:diguanylate cyclase (GGDEF)-like protein